MGLPNEAVVSFENKNYVFEEIFIPTYILNKYIISHTDVNIEEFNLLSIYNNSHIKTFCFLYILSGFELCHCRKKQNLNLFYDFVDILL